MNEFRSQVFDASRSSRKSKLLGTKRPRGASVAAGLRSVPVPRSESRTCDTRDADRHRLTGERVTVTHRRKTHECELVNLSGGGAMIAGGVTPKLWDRVELHLAEDASIECTVQWIKNERVGLQFAPETQVDCSPEDLRALLCDVVARSFPDLMIEFGPVGEVEAAPASKMPSVDEENRRDERIPLVWKGTLHFDFTSTPVRFRNISRTGALIECELPLPVGSEPLIDIGESGSVFATVTWGRGEQFGLRFKEPFDLALLSRTKPEIVPLWREGGFNPHAARDTDETVSFSELRERLEGFMRR